MSSGLVKVIVGCVLGTALGAALIYGMVELADFMVERTDEFSR